jgi:hypothetical protein
MPTIHLTKLDAAKRQLVAAVELYFRDGDPVSVHTLGWSAYTSLGDLGKHRGVPPNFFQHFLAFCGNDKEKRKKLALMFRHARNFFEHAKDDSDATLDFDPILSVGTISDAILHYEILSNNEFVPSLFLFTSWNFLNQTDKHEPHLRRFIEGVFRGAFVAAQGNRAKYYADAMPLALELEKIFSQKDLSTVDPKFIGTLLDAVGLNPSKQTLLGGKS